MDFQIGDKVVYPNQGVGIVEQISTRNLTGQPEMFYLLKLNASSLRVMVPTSSVVNVGLRRVARNTEIGTILGYLEKGRVKAPQDWKGRFKENSEKMRNGSLQDVAEVFKSLLLLNQAKPLSFREKKMLDRSWQLLVDEIAIARGMAKETVEGQLVKALNKSNLKVPLPS
ncbi:MAG: CarD family transcriptional regulator [Acidobacteriia bacterium]|nr:CarD family transcriptional regulator [Terriglobia bacterium]